MLYFDYWLRKRCRMLWLLYVIVVVRGVFFVMVVVFKLVLYFKSSMVKLVLLFFVVWNSGVFFFIVWVLILVLKFSNFFSRVVFLLFCEVMLSGLFFWIFFGGRGFGFVFVLRRSLMYVVWFWVVVLDNGLEIWIFMMLGLVLKLSSVVIVWILFLVVVYVSGVCFMEFWIFIFLGFWISFFFSIWSESFKIILWICVNLDVLMKLLRK